MLTDYIALMKQLGIPSNYDMAAIVRVLKEDKSESPFEFIENVRTTDLSEEERIFVSMVKTYVILNREKTGDDMEKATQDILNIVKGLELTEILTLLSTIVLIVSLQSSDNDHVKTSETMMVYSDIIAATAEKIYQKEKDNK